MQSLKLHYRNNFYQSLRITRNQTFCSKLRSRKRGNSFRVFHRISLKYSNNQRGLTRLHLTPFCLKLCGEKHRITRHFNADLQTAKQTLRATKYSIESTYSDLPCYFKVNSGKLALINRPQKCKKGKDRRSLLVHSRKLAEHDNSSALFPAVTVTVVRDRKIFPISDHGHSNGGKQRG